MIKLETHNFIDFCCIAEVKGCQECNENTHAADPDWYFEINFMFFCVYDIYM